MVGTQIVATLIAVYGLFMTPLGWGWAGFVWGYALLWFLVNDRIKLLAYRIFDPVKAVANIDSKTEAKAKAQTDTKADPQADAKVEPKPVAKAETKPEPNAKPAAELSSQLVKRVHEFYEQLGREDVRAVQELEEAEQKISEVETQK